MSVCKICQTNLIYGDNGALGEGRDDKNEDWFSGLVRITQISTLLVQTLTSTRSSFVTQLLYDIFVDPRVEILVTQR